MVGATGGLRGSHALSLSRSRHQLADLAWTPLPEITLGPWPHAAPQPTGPTQAASFLGGLPRWVVMPRPRVGRTCRLLVVSGDGCLGDLGQLDPGRGQPPRRSLWGRDRSDRPMVAREPSEV